MNWRRILIPCALLVVAAMLSACGSTPVYEHERFNPRSPYQYRVTADLDSTCEAARLALLSQGYDTRKAGPYQLQASKSFQPNGDIHAVIEFNVACAATRKGTMLYANAIEKRYKLGKTSQSAGFSVPSVGSISVPWGSSNESLSMVGGKTISAPDFYKRYYDLVEKQLAIEAPQRQ